MVSSCDRIGPRRKNKITIDQLFRSALQRRPLPHGPQLPQQSCVQRGGLVPQEQVIYLEDRSR